MSRHRNVRAMNIDEEYDGYYDSAYGHSVEEEFCISPRTEAQFLYNRDAQKHSMSAFLDASPDSQMDEYGGNEGGSRVRCDSVNERPNLSNTDRAKLQSCVEAMQNVVGDTISESILIKAATENHFDLEKALDSVLSGAGAFEKPKPPRSRNVNGTKKEFCIHSKYASPDYTGLVSKNNRHCKCNIKPSSYSSHPSIYDPLILDLLKMFIAFIEFSPIVEKQCCCNISGGNRFTSHFKFFYSMLVPFFTKFSSSDVFIHRYKIWKRLCCSVVDFKNEPGTQALVYSGHVVNKKFCIREFHCIKKLLRFFLELLHSHSSVTKFSLLSDEEHLHLTEIMQFFQSHLPMTVHHPSACIPSSNHFWFHCKNHSITNKAVSVSCMPAMHKCEALLHDRKSSSFIETFLSSVSCNILVNCLQYKTLIALQRNQHPFMARLSLPETGDSHKRIHYMMYKKEYDSGNTSLVTYSCLLLNLLKSDIWRLVTGVKSLKAAICKSQFNTEKCDNSNCKYQLQHFCTSVKYLKNEHQVLLNLLKVIQNYFAKSENERMWVSYAVSNGITCFSDGRDIELKTFQSRHNQKKHFIVKNQKLNFSRPVIDVLVEGCVFVPQVYSESKHPFSLQYGESVNTYKNGKFALYQYDSRGKRIIWKHSANGYYSKTTEPSFCRLMCRMNLTCSKELFMCADGLPQIVIKNYNSLGLFLSTNESPFLHVHVEFVENTETDASYIISSCKNIDILKFSNKVISVLDKCPELSLSHDQVHVCYCPIKFSLCIKSGVSDVLQIFASECSSDALHEPKQYTLFLTGSHESDTNEMYDDYFFHLKCLVSSEHDCTNNVNKGVSTVNSLNCQICPSDHYTDLVDGGTQGTELSMEMQGKEMVSSVRNLNQLDSKLSFPYSVDDVEFEHFITVATSDAKGTVESGTSWNADLSALSGNLDESSENDSDVESCDDLSLDDLFLSLSSDSIETLLSDNDSLTTCVGTEYIDTGQDHAFRNKLRRIDGSAEVANDLSCSDLYLSMESSERDDDSIVPFEAELQEVSLSDVPLPEDSSPAEELAPASAAHKTRNVLHTDSEFSTDCVVINDKFNSSENVHVNIQSSFLSGLLPVGHNRESIESDTFCCTGADSLSYALDGQKKLSVESKQHQLSHNVPSSHKCSVTSEVVSNQCHSNEQQSCEHSLLSELCFDEKSGIFDEKNMLNCTPYSDTKGNEYGGIGNFSDEQIGLLNKSVSNVYLDFRGTSENSDFQHASGGLPAVISLDKCNSTERLDISSVCLLDVQNEIAIPPLSDYHESELQNFGEKTPEVHDKVSYSLSDLFNHAECSDILKNSDTLASQNETDLSYSDILNSSKSCTNNVSENLSCDLSFLNSFNNDNNKLQQVTNSDTEQMSLSDLFLGNRCISPSTDNTSTDASHLSCTALSYVSDKKREITKNLWENENHSLPGLCTNVEFSADSAVYGTAKQDCPVENIALSDLCFKVDSELEYPSKYLGNDELSKDSLSDHSVVKVKRQDPTKNDCNTKHTEVPKISLSELYHSMKPVKEEKYCICAKSASLPAPSFSNLSINLEPEYPKYLEPSKSAAEKNVGHSSLLDLYINSESGRYFDTDSGASSQKFAGIHLSSELTVVGNMNELGRDYLRTKMTVSGICEKDPETSKFIHIDEVDSRNGISEAKFFVEDNDSCATHIPAKGNGTQIHTTSLSPESLRHTSEPVDGNSVDIPCIDLSVAQKHLHSHPTDFHVSDIPSIDMCVAQRYYGRPGDFHTSDMSPSSKKSPSSDSVYVNSNIFSAGQETEIVIKTKKSLFAKVLKCKSKPSKTPIFPRPPQTLPEILESIGYTKYFQFSTPSPDEVVKKQQKGALSCPDSSSTIKPPNLETVEDEKEFACSDREISGRMIISNGEIRTPEECESMRNAPALPEGERDCEKAIEKSGSSVDEEKSKNDEQSSILPAEQLSKLKIDANDKEVLEAYKKERGGNKPLINLVVIGHVDAGKSTLMGHLLYRLGCVGKKTMHKYEQDSKKLGKSSFMYAWVLDETSEERNRGITMDVAQSKFDTPHRSVTLLDAPGHKDFIPNMITGAAQADVAVLVLDSTRGEFETGFEAGGQTREHTMLIRSLGVSQLAVAVNKLDNVNWDQERYKEIVSKLSAFLKQAGFKESEVQFVPCSGLTGENLIKPPELPELKKWYSGPCLVDVIDSFKPPERPVSKPLRFCISDVFKGMGSGFCVSGRIEAGYVQNGDKVLVMPAAEQATVKGMTIDETTVQHSFAGDHVTLQLSGVDINNVTTGCVVCDIARPVKVSARFQARLVIFNITVPITKGFPVILHYQSMSEQAFVKKLISQLHRSTGQVVKKKPRCLTKNSSAVVEIEVMKPICLEVYKDFKELGRFMLRSSGSTIAAGLVTEIL